MSLLKDLKVTHGIEVCCVHYDNTGENESFEQTCKWEGWMWNLLTPCLAHHNTTREWKESSLLSSIGYMPCSTMGFLIFKKQFMSLGR